jgi:RNA polymerase sigma-70 factor (ECF subfamily)
MRAESIARPAAVATPEASAGRIEGLFDAHHQRLYRLARRLSGNTEDAWDLVQDVFLRAARNPARVPEDPAREEAWLVRILVNLQRDEWRKRQVRARADARARRPTDTPPRQESVLLARAQIWKALERLPPRRRAVLVLHELEGASVDHIAALLGISVITARWHLSRGRRDLERSIGRGQGEPS